MSFSSNASRVIFISDIHIGTGEKWSWFDYGKTGDEYRLIQFLGYLAKHPDPNFDVVFLGDMIDTWVCPPHIPPPGAEQILNASKNAPIIDAMKQLSQTHKVYYVSGNHDFKLTQQILNTYVPQINFLGNTYTNEGLSLHAEHGHLYGMFNAPDPVNDPEEHLPIGYYTSRLFATESKADSFETLQNIFATSIEHVKTLFDDSKSHPELTDLVIDAVVALRGLDNSTKILMPDGGQITVAQVKGRYKKLFHQYQSLDKNPAYVWKHVFSDASGLKFYANDLRSTPNSRLIVLGHSHQMGCNMDHKFFWGFDSIYLNSGTWLGKDYSTYAEVLKKDGKIIARVHSYNQDQKDTILKNEKHLDVEGGKVNGGIV